jgi:nucleoporin NUP159
MAFGFSNSGNAMLGSAAGAGGLTTGPDLETIQTEVSALVFLSLSLSLSVYWLVLLTAPT